MTTPMPGVCNIQLGDRICPENGANSGGGNFYLCDTAEQPGGSTQAYDLVSVSRGDADLGELIDTLELPITSRVKLGGGIQCAAILRPEEDVHQRYACQAPNGRTFRVAVSRLHVNENEQFLQPRRRVPGPVRVLQGVLAHDDVAFDLQSYDAETGIAKGTVGIDDDTANFTLTGPGSPQITLRWSDGRKLTIDDVYTVEKFRSGLLGTGNL